MENKGKDKKSKPKPKKVSKAVSKLNGTLLKKEEVGKTFSLYDTIKDSPLRKVSSTEKRSLMAKKYLDEEFEGQKLNKNGIHPGMLMSFNYFQPKTKDKLEYYDANPCVIFFGEFNSKEGKRVLGFNIHYYPPQLRFRILDWIFKTFRSYFTGKWDSTGSQKNGTFNYAVITAQLDKAKLDFGVREYDPVLMSNVKQITPKYFQVAVFTEGQFMKETRQQILSYWKGKGGSIV